MHVMSGRKVLQCMHARDEGGCMHMHVMGGVHAHALTAGGRR